MKLRSNARAKLRARSTKCERSELPSIARQLQGQLHSGRDRPTEERQARHEEAQVQCEEHREAIGQLRATLRVQFPPPMQGHELQQKKTDLVGERGPGLRAHRRSQTCELRGEEIPKLAVEAIHGRAEDG